MCEVNAERGIASGWGCGKWAWSEDVKYRTPCGKWKVDMLRGKRIERKETTSAPWENSRVSRGSSEVVSARGFTAGSLRAYTYD